ncbi:hypothetical protein C8R43DRAFT_1140598 [Mycena crocata]|nr:hypothetical protein C8R43DRAFT_1140598 [Mycena crocata]
MSFLPPWSELTLQRRATSLFIKDTFIIATAAELALAALRQPQSSLAWALDQPETDWESDSSSENDSGENTPPPASRWSAAFLAEFAPFVNAGLPRLRQPLADITPMPHVFRPGHLRALGFHFVNWKDQPGAFLDMRERVGAFYVGFPEERLTWERSIIEASQAMESACWYLDTARLDKEGISYGIRYPKGRFERPENTSTHGMCQGNPCFRPFRSRIRTLRSRSDPFRLLPISHGL